MSIANEISGEVAAALLTKAKTSGDLKVGSADSNELAQLVFNLHSTLRDITTEARRESHRSRRPAPPPAETSGNAAAGS
jgi:hypothetical protein